MAGEFEYGVIDGAQEMGHSISEVAMEFGFLRTAIPQVYREHRECSNATTSLRLIKDDARTEPTTRNIKRNRRATLPHIAADFNAGPSTSVSARTIQQNTIDMDFRSRRTTRVLLLTVQHKALRLVWVLLHRRLLVTGNTLPGLTSLVSN
ncbi:HTH_Tnp_Tc3_2 domain-containing protein [Trichonephila clavipes]|nr:HTH_Tnp_Tc3_2 domain-containing protein [Trichonephila clavipes]